MNTLYQRMIRNWSIRRFVYLLAGGLFIVQGLISNEWPVIIGGAYFGAMGLFAFGCAGNNCQM